MKFLTNSFFISFILLIFGCSNKNEVFVEYKDLPSETWKWDNPLDFEFEIKDSVYTHNFNINLRLTDAYPKSNIYIQGKWIMPSGDTINKLYNLLLFNTEGASFGEKSGKFLNYCLNINKNNNLPNGKYKITLTQFTRSFELNGINALGIGIYKGEPVF